MYSYETHSTQSAPSQNRSLLQRFKDWVRREIVDDDPWDTSTLFPSEDFCFGSFADLPITFEHPDAAENQL
jgi:hypothetical protein